MKYFKIFLSFVCFHFLALFYSQYKEVNIEDFKVNGTDKLDDTQNFDNAVEYIAKNGGTLSIPKGNYYLDNKKRVRKGVYNNSYIFIINNNIKIKLDKEAVLYYKNDFKGFRFRSTQDPNDQTINKYEVEIDGGIVDGTGNNVTRVKDNPNIWAFLGETLQKFQVTNLMVRNLYGTAAISSYSNNLTVISNNSIQNVTGNPLDYIDNHGDGIYIANTNQYEVFDNKVKNNIDQTNRIGRVGICIEYDRSRSGKIYNNSVTGYDRGIHIEYIKGTATIYNNKLIGNSSGIVLWNNYDNKQILDSNTITNTGLKKDNKPLLYSAAPILILGLNTNKGTVIKDNKITIYKEFFIPNNLLQVTSDDVQIINNSFVDNTKTLSLSISQGDGDKKRVKRIIFTGNKVIGNQILAFDGSDLDISNNQLDVNEVSFSFDQSNNIYRNNTIINKSAARKVNLVGKYAN